MHKRYPFFTVIQVTLTCPKSIFHVAFWASNVCSHKYAYYHRYIFIQMENAEKWTRGNYKVSKILSQTNPIPPLSSQFWFYFFNP
jgi:hypothetical protein